MKKLLIGAVGIAILAFLWWTISPLFITNEVQDELDPALEALLTENTIGDTSTESTTVIEPITVTAPAVSSPTPDTLPEPVARGPFSIIGTPGHAATGQLRFINTDTEQLIRFEDYNGTNGPDLRIYLATDLEATDFIDLGPAKGNKGNINYSVPSDIDIDDYPYAMTWCRAFGVLFDYAKIQ